jgi:hypothetical protein
MKQDEAIMSDGINGQIGEEGQMPLLVIAEESDETAPALIVVEEPEAAPTLPAPAVEAIATQPEIEIVAPTPHAQPAAAKPAAAVEAKPAKVEAPQPPAIEPAPAAAASVPLPHPSKEIEEAAAVAPAAAKPRRAMIHPLVPLAAVSLAVFASSVSVIGLLVASRTVAETRIVLEQVQAHQAKMRHLDTVIDEVDALRRREQIALMRIEQINAGKPATGAEVRGAIANLQIAMAKFQPGGSNGTLALLRDGQSELAERVSTMYRRVDAVNDKMDKLTAGKVRAPESR